ncbi:hypothetical protein Tco_0043427, partial [Tanacetum coccineum]
MAQDSLGYDWSDQAAEGPTNFALMAYTSSSASSSVTKVSTCSKACLKYYATLKEHYDKPLADYKKSQLNVCAYKSGLESVEARLEVDKKNEAIFEEDIKVLKLDVMLRDNALTELRKKFEKAKKEKDDLKLLDCQISDNLKHGFSVTSIKTSETKASDSTTESLSELIIEELTFDSEEEQEIESRTRQTKPSNAKFESIKSKEHVKTTRESVRKVEYNMQANYPRKTSQSPRGNQRNWNNLMTQRLGSDFEFRNKACYVCGSFDHLIKDCDFYEKKMVQKPVWNNASRVNHQNSKRISHPHPKRNFVPSAVLMKSSFKTLNTARQNSSRAAVSVNTTRQINTA